jgi:hypothetical protein
VPVAIANWQRGFSDLRHELLSVQVLLMILVAPPLVAILALWVTYPRGRWILAILIGIFGEYFALILGVAVWTKLTAR